MLLLVSESHAHQGQAYLGGEHRHTGYSVILAQATSVGPVGSLVQQQPKSGLKVDDSCYHKGS